jgi:hypothetical protein
VKIVAIAVEKCPEAISKAKEDLSKIVCGDIKQSEFFDLYTMKEMVVFAEYKKEVNAIV